jgi:hypothetical protein
MLALLFDGNSFYRDNFAVKFVKKISSQLDNMYCRTQMRLYLYQFNLNSPPA